MSLQGLLVPPFTVAGRINSGAFHKAKAIAEGSGAYASATTTPMLPADYDKLLEALKVEHGGPAYLHNAGVVVFSEKAGFIGDDLQLLTWLKRNKVPHVEAGLNSDGRAESWDTIAEEAYLALLTSSELSFAFLELTQGKTVLGRLIFELYEKIAPRTCENFLGLCSGSYGERQDLASYVGTPIHRIKPGGWLQGGDVTTGAGDGGVTASGAPLPDESFEIKHAEAGVLGMVNNGAPHTATSQFYVTFAPCPTFDRKYVAFGRLVDGTRLLKYLETVETVNERPTEKGKAIVISDAGKVVAKELALMDMDEDDAAAKLQAMQRGRKERKERKERAEAAKRVQAAKRGAKARQEAREQQQAAVKVQAISRGRKARQPKK